MSLATPSDDAQADGQQSFDTFAKVNFPKLWREQCDLRYNLTTKLLASLITTHRPADGGPW